MKFVIDRSKWLRGEGPDNSRLIRSEDGKMCCLGFFGMACGLEAERITNEYSPSEIAVENDGRSSADIWEDANPVSAFLFNGADDSEDCGQLMEINDSLTINREDREKFIARIFAMHDVEVEFIGE